jgi:hypothetical protein
MGDDLREAMTIRLCMNKFALHPGPVEALAAIDDLLALLAERGLKITDFSEPGCYEPFDDWPPYPGAQEAGDD